MTDDEITIDDEELPKATPSALDRKRAALAKARLARDSRRTEPRTAAPRTAAQPQQSAPPPPAERAPPAREEFVPEQFTRRPRADRQISGLDLPRQYKRAGWDYEWKTIRVFNQPVDMSEIQDHAEAGWIAERARNWPTLVDASVSPNGPIERQGLRLYTRPLSLTMEARTEDYNIANEQQHDRIRAAATGRSARRDEEAMPRGRGVQIIPLGVGIEGVAG